MPHGYVDSARPSQKRHARDRSGTARAGARLARATGDGCRLYRRLSCRIPGPASSKLIGGEGGAGQERVSSRAYVGARARGNPRHPAAVLAGGAPPSLDLPAGAGGQLSARPRHTLRNACAITPLVDHVRVRVADRAGTRSTRRRCRAPAVIECALDVGDRRPGRGKGRLQPCVQRIDPVVHERALTRALRHRSLSQLRSPISHGSGCFRPRRR